MDRRQSSKSKSSTKSTPGASTTLRKTHLKARNSKNYGGDTKVLIGSRHEVDVDQWHTRESVRYSLRSPQIAKVVAEEDNKSTTNSGYLPSLGTDFNIVFDPEFLMPEFKGKDRLEAIRELGEALKLTDYETNLISFWILEMLSTVLKRSQISHMLLENQKVSIQWIIYILKTIMFYGLKRREMFKHLEQLFIQVDSIVHSGEPIPTPYTLLQELTDKSATFDNLTKINSSTTTGSPKKEKINAVKTDKSPERLAKDGLTKTASEEKTMSRKSNISRRSLRFKRRRSFSGMSLTRNVIAQERDADFYSLIENIYSVFGCTFKYEVIYQVFSEPVYVKTIVITDNILRPKEYAAPYPVHVLSGRYTSTRRSATKSKVVPQDRKKNERKKSVREDFLQKTLKLVLEEPIPKDELKDLAPKSLPYLLPLNEATDLRFLNKSQLHHRSTRKSAMGHTGSRMAHEQKRSSALKLHSA